MRETKYSRSSSHPKGDLKKKKVDYEINITFNELYLI